MARSLALLLITASTLTPMEASAQQIFNSGSRSACIENDCRSKSLSQQYHTTPTRRLNSTIISLNEEQNDLYGTLGAYEAERKSDCRKGLTFLRVFNGSDLRGVCSPMTPRLNTTLQTAFQEIHLEQTSVHQSTLDSSEINQVIHSNISAARDTIPTMNRSYDPIEQISTNASKIKDPAPPYTVPHSRRAIERLVTQTINQTFQATTEVHPLRGDIFDQPFSESALQQMKTP